MSYNTKRSYSSIIRLLLAFLLALTMLLLTGGGIQSLAASGIWQGFFSNIWNLNDNWMPGGYPNASGEVAIFGGGAETTHVVISNTQVTVGGIIIISSNAYTISGESGGSLVFQSATSYPATVFASGQTAHTISLPVMLASDLNITNSSSGLLTFLGDIGEASGSSNLLISIREGRPVAFSGVNSYSGGTNIRGGTLLLGGNTSAGSGPISLLCSTNPCFTPETPASLGNLTSDTVLQNPLMINHSFVQFTGPGSMSFTSLDSSISASAKAVITGTLNLAKLQDPSLSRNLRRSGSGTLNLNITPEGTNIGDFIRSDPGSGQLNLYGSGRMGRIYYRDGSGGGTIGVGDNLDVTTGEVTRATGVLTVTGVLETGTDTPGQADRVLSFDLRGTEPGIGYDQIVIQEMDYGGILSTARITDTLLSVSIEPSFNPPIGTEFTLIHRTGGDGTPDDVIHGTFRDLPDGAIFLIDGLTFQIHYTPDEVILTRHEPPIIEIITGTPQSTWIGTEFPQQLEVHVRYPDNSPAIGVPIYFTAPSTGASATFVEAIPVVTDDQGNASVTAIANMFAGSYQVLAGVQDPNVTPAEFDLTNISSGPSYLEVTGFPSPVIAGVTGTFMVTIRDPGNQIITDYTGTLTFSSSDPSAILPPDYIFTLADAGQHSFSATFLTAGTNHFLRATDTLTPTLTGEQNGIVVLPAEPAQIGVVSGSPQSTRVATTFSEPLVVRVTDAFSNTVPGIAVTFSGPSVGAGAVFTGTNPVMTDSAGLASLVVGANTYAGSYQVTASIDTPGVNPVNFALANAPGPVVELRVFGYPSLVKAGSTHPFMVTANDRYGNINPGYRGSTYSLSSDPLAILPQDYLFTAQDAGLHIFNATFKTAGTHYITIVDNSGLRGTQSGIVVEPLGPASLMIDKYTSQSPQSAPVTTAFPKPLAVILTDIYGNPQSGFVITFTVPSSGASAVLMGANPQTTGNDGKASLNATANTVAGSYEVLVTTNASGVAPFKFALSNLPGPASTLTYVSGSMQEADLGMPFANPLVVEVNDAYGNLVPGVWVTFSAPQSGASCILSNAGQALTSYDGRAHQFVTANTVAGSYMVEARLPGNPAPVLFYLTNKMMVYLPLVFR